MTAQGRFAQVGLGTADIHSPPRLSVWASSRWECPFPATAIGRHGLRG